MASRKCEYGKRKSGECKKKPGPKKKSVKKSKRGYGRSYGYNLD